MSSSAWSSPPVDKRPMWYFAIPWTGEQTRAALQIRRADPDSTKDQAVSDSIARAQADQRDFPQHLFRWARMDISAIIEKRLRTEDFRMGYYNLSNGHYIAMIVLRTKRGDSESDLDESPDLHEPRATDAQVEVLRSKGWVVEWYRACPNWF
ncbi:hypothetical protein GSI_08593 [Ganoderma sinense ZZ0214-1]|uniref:Uncharacterized protein n=1 Tax=Ganoderma sinense ZZ0214-1 TaxID=1077348 RepID=A0A2G8S458_9APHY|nr:hypothetical protein GSI_08593 [Ganoderma sinense ZZ0214-1]